VITKLPVNVRCTNTDYILCCPIRMLVFFRKRKHLGNTSYAPQFCGPTCPQSC
jgi:hypothetical protein